MRKILYIILISLLFFISACSSNIEEENSNNLDNSSENNYNNISDELIDFDFNSLIIGVNTQLIERTNEVGVDFESSDEIFDILSLTIEQFDSVIEFEVSTIYRTTPFFVISIVYEDPDFSDVDELQRIIAHLLSNEEFSSVEKNYFLETTDFS